MFDLRDKVDTAAKVAGCTATAAAAAVAAVLFLCLALFVWVRHIYGAVIASLVLAGVFVLIALVALIVARFFRRRSQMRLERRSPPANTQWWTDPIVLAAVLQVVRVLGARRIAVPLFLGGMLGTMISHPSRRRRTNAHRHDTQRDDAHQQDAVG